MAATPEALRALAKQHDDLAYACARLAKPVSQMEAHKQMAADARREADRLEAQASRAGRAA